MVKYRQPAALAQVGAWSPRGVSACVGYGVCGWAPCWSRSA
jgi:hypothetical protein